MAFIYTFTESEVIQLEAVRVVFNRFTESSLDIQQFIKFTIDAAITANNESAEIALKFSQNAKIYHRIDAKKKVGANVH